MEQVEVTRRYLERIRQIYKGTFYTDNKEYFTDDVYSFFIHCHHLKDWISELNKVGVTKTQIHKFIKNNKPLKICADLCNGKKHCILNEHQKWTDRQPHIVRKQFISSGVNNTMQSVKGKFTILSDGELHDVLELAEKCMKLWDEYIKKLKEKVN